MFCKSVASTGPLLDGVDWRTSSVILEEQIAEHDAALSLRVFDQSADIEHRLARAGKVGRPLGQERDVVAPEDRLAVLLLVRQVGVFLVADR